MTRVVVVNATQLRNRRFDELCDQPEIRKIRGAGQQQTGRGQQRQAIEVGQRWGFGVLSQPRRPRVALQHFAKFLRSFRPDARTCEQRVLPPRSEEHTSELQSLMRTSYAVLCL